MTNVNIIEAVLLIVLLVFAAVTAASEIAIIAANRFKLRRMASEGSKAARLVLSILEAPERFLGTILVANNVLETLIAAIVTAIVISFIGQKGKSVLFATLIAAFLIIVFEVAAKTLAARHSERMAVYLARPVKVFIFILSPVVKILAVITNFIVGLVGSRGNVKTALVTEEEIRTMIEIGQEEGAIHKEKYRLLSRVFDFSDAIVKDVMTPKGSMVAIDIFMKLDDILEKVLESGYSRIPVYRDTPENIVGVVNMKDLLNLSFNRGLFVLQDILYPAIFVASSKKVADLLKEFQKGHTHIAIVIDAQNKIEGIVTLEDLLEEIVGEIEDEHDVRASSYKPRIL